MLNTNYFVDKKIPKFNEVGQSEVDLWLHPWKF